MLPPCVCCSFGRGLRGHSSLVVTKVPPAGTADHVAGHQMLGGDGSGLGHPKAPGGLLLPGHPGTIDLFYILHRKVQAWSLLPELHVGPQSLTAPLWQGRGQPTQAQQPGWFREGAPPFGGFLILGAGDLPEESETWRCE